MKLALKRIEQAADYVYTFWFEPESPVRFIAGQYAEFYLPHTQADQRGERRWFSISSSPNNPLIAITTKHLAHESSSFKRALFGSSPGSVFYMTEPMGDFVLPKDKTIPLIYIAGGVGITPVHSMLTWLHEAKQKRDVQIIYAGKKQSELAFAEELSAYGHAFTQLLDDAQAVDRQGKNSHSAIIARILKHVDHKPRALYFLSGPETMAEALTAALSRLGIDKQHIALDYFPGYEEL